MKVQKKYSAYLATLGVSAVLCAQGGLTGEEFAGVIKVALTIFVIGNAAVHYVPNKGRD